MRKNAVHVFEGAFWLWPEGELYLNNCYAQFRYDFDLDAVPDHAALCITADQSYRLWVNGRYVCRGPARGYQSHWPYDEPEIAAFLKPGHNFLSIEAYNPGIHTFQYSHCGCAGMICAAHWGDVHILSGVGDWQMRRSPANNPNVARLSRQMAYQEDFDAARDDGSWIRSETAPHWVLQERFRWSGKYRFDALPWLSVEPREVPLLRETPLTPERILFHGVGVMAEGWETCFNIAWHWTEKELSSVKRWDLPAAAEKKGNFLEFTAEPPGGNRFRAITVDLGGIVSGTPILELAGTAGCEICDCYLHQSLQGSPPRNLFGETNYGMIAMALRMRCAKGLSRREFFPLLAGHEITLIFRNLKKPVTARIAWRIAEYPFSMHGAFDFGDEILNGIMRICRATQQRCTIDSYVDTMWREQGQWWGDARIQARNTFYMDGDIRPLKRGIRSIAENDMPLGLTAGVAPGPNNVLLPDFSLTWILTHYDYWFQTGSLELFGKFHDRIRGIFAYFDGTEDEDEILQADPRFWLFEDWAALPKTGRICFLNLWRLYILEHYRLLLQAAKLDETETAAKIARLRKSLVEKFYDPDARLFRATLDEKWIPTLHDQVLAVLLKLRPDANDTIKETRVLPFLRDEKCDFAVPSSFWCSYLFDAVMELGCRKEAVEFIRRHWSRMIPSGGTWEHLVYEEEAGTSCCHAWSAHPLFHLPNLILGIRQTAPHWERVEIEPEPELIAGTGSIRLPLPQGDFIVSWQDGAWEASAPDGVRILPPRS